MYGRSEVLWVKTRSAAGQSCQTNKRSLLKMPPRRRIIPVSNSRDHISPAEKREFPVAPWLTPQRSTYSIFKGNTTISASCSHKQPMFLNIDPPLAPRPTITSPSSRFFTCVSPRGRISPGSCGLTAPGPQPGYGTHKQGTDGEDLWKNM